MTNLNIKVVLEKDKESGGYIAYCPALKGCVSQGDTKKEAFENIKDAIDGYLQVLVEMKFKDIQKANMQKVARTRKISREVKISPKTVLRHMCAA